MKYNIDRHSKKGGRNSSYTIFQNKISHLISYSNFLSILIQYQNFKSIINMEIDYNL